MTQIGVTESVTGNYFATLGLQPALGRLISNQDEPNGEPIAVISWSFWNSKFNQDPSVLGKHIVVHDTPATIIGVAPRTFAGLRVEDSPDAWLMLAKNQTFALVGRLKPGATIQEARAEMAVLYRFTIDERSKTSSDPLVRKLKIEIEPAGAGLSTVRDRYAPILFVLMGLVGLLLLIACVNIAGILLARGATREREMAVRVGLGASRSRLLRQVLTESALLSVIGTLAGVFFSHGGTQTLIHILESGRDHERIHLRVEPDLHLLFFAIGIAVLASLLFGLAPALQAFRIMPVAALRQSMSSSGTFFQRWFGKSLVAAQVALSVLLLSSAALFVSYLWSLEHTDLGFRKDHVLLVRLDRPAKLPPAENAPAIYQELLLRLEQIPGVRSASISSPTPLSGAGASGFAIVDGFVERPADRRWISIGWAAPKFFQTLGTPLLAGRDFNFQDQAHSQIAIINRAMAQYYFQHGNPIGKRITLYHVTQDPESRSYEVVGVVADAHYYEIREAPGRTIYLPAFRDKSVVAENLVLRTNTDPAKVSADVMRVEQSILKDVPIAKITTLTDQVDSSILPERLMATLSGVFASLAVLLASVGLYGLLAYTVACRTNEIGIRLTLGATPGHVTRMVMAETFAILAVGLGLGIPLALLGRIVAAPIIGGTQMTDAIGPLLIGTCIVLMGAVVASYIPAWRASHVDPMLALRHE